MSTDITRATTGLALSFALLLIGIALAGGGCREAPPSFEWNGQEWLLVVDSVERQADRLLVRGRVNQLPFELTFIDGVTRQLSISGEGPGLWMSVDEAGELRYGISSQYAADNEHSVTVNQALVETDPSALAALRERADPSYPREDLDASGAGLWLAMLPELLGELDDPDDPRVQELRATVGTSYAALYQVEAASLWNGTITGSCYITCDEGSCGCSSVFCGVGTYGGTTWCRCIAMGWGPFSSTWPSCSCTQCWQCES